MNKPLLSVIIPCFNSGLYLREAVESVGKNADLLTIIIINDGSTDEATLSLLHQLQGEGYRIVHQENKGPGAARNAGVRASDTPYLFFLDSDNMVRNGYIEEGIKLLESHREVGVFYGRPNFLGATTDRLFPTKPFDLPSLLVNNYIDLCALVRRTAWESVEGFDENRLLIGQEDWDFWIRLGGHGWGFHFCDKVLFDYRVRPDSLSSQVRKHEIAQYVFAKNAAIVRKCYLEIHKQYRFYQYDKRHPVRSFVKFFYLKLRTGK
jgi:glycosyltransferase involved in cell wall biosynthesis